MPTRSSTRARGSPSALPCGIANGGVTPQVRELGARLAAIGHRPIYPCARAAPRARIWRVSIRPAFVQGCLPERFRSPYPYAPYKRFSMQSHAILHRWAWAIRSSKKSTPVVNRRPKKRCMRCARLPKASRQGGRRLMRPFVSFSGTCANSATRSSLWSRYRTNGRLRRRPPWSRIGLGAERTSVHRFFVAG